MRKYDVRVTVSSLAIDLEVEAESESVAKMKVRAHLSNPKKFYSKKSGGVAIVKAWSDKSEITMEDVNEC